MPGTAFPIKNNIFFVSYLTQAEFYTGEANRNFCLSFDGVIIHATDASSPLRTIYGTTESEYIQGFDDGRFIIYGCDGTDTINGANSDDYLYGGIGDDKILGYAGNDTLDGEEGNDYLEGGLGDDTYVFHIGSGTDTIHDNEGINRISFGEGIDKNSITACKTNGNDLTIMIEGAEDKLVIQGYFLSVDNRKFDITFADGSRIAYDSVENPLNQEDAESVETFEKDMEKEKEIVTETEIRTEEK